MRHAYRIMTATMIALVVAAAADDGLQSELRNGRSALSASTLGDQTAIVDAAIAFERANRLVDERTPDDTASEIRASLYWCRKSMDVTTITTYRERLAQLDAPARQRTPVTGKPPASVASTRAATPSASVVSTGAAAPSAPSAPGIASRRGEILALAQAAVQAGLHTRLHSTIAAADAMVDAIDPAGEITVQFATGAVLHLPFQRLDSRELASLALDATRGSAAQHDDLRRLAQQTLAGR